MNTTFTATFTFPTESIIAFAKAPISQGGLGYQDTIQVLSKNPITGIPMYVSQPNPEAPLDFVARKAKEHNEKFTSAWAKNLVQQQVQAQTAPITAHIHASVEAQILQPVIDAIQVTYQ